MIRDPIVNPDRVVFRKDSEGTVIFMGTMSYAGNQYQDFLKRELVVLAVFY